MCDIITVAITVSNVNTEAFSRTSVQRSCRLVRCLLGGPSQMAATGCSLRFTLAMSAQLFLTIAIKAPEFFLSVGSSIPASPTQLPPCATNAWQKRCPICAILGYGAHLMGLLQSGWRCPRIASVALASGSRSKRMYRGSGSRRVNGYIPIASWRGWCDRAS